MPQLEKGWAASHNPDAKTNRSATGAQGWFHMMPKNSWHFQSSHLVSDRSLHRTGTHRKCIPLIFPKWKTRLHQLSGSPKCCFISPKLCCPVVVQQAYALWILLEFRGHPSDPIQTLGLPSSIPRFNTQQTLVYHYSKSAAQTVSTTMTSRQLWKQAKQSSHLK